MKKALLLAVMALSLVSCQSEGKEKSGWRNDALSIEVKYGYQYGGDTYRKEENEGLKRDLFYRINGESSLTIKTVLTDKTISTRDNKPYQETHIYDFLNCSYKITLAV